HIMGYLKDHIDGGDKAELIASIEAYRREEVSLVVPMTLLRHHLRRHPDPYMQRQVYLAPYPEKLGLRGAI
ncbi:MAG: YbgA family protein, partial [Gammaproteobacteria bacterium]|nr:YbgA family protein [Gammaproteobacteria bacterium]